MAGACAPDAGPVPAGAPHSLSSAAWWAAAVAGAGMPASTGCALGLRGLPFAPAQTSVCCKRPVIVMLVTKPCSVWCVSVCAPCPCPSLQTHWDSIARIALKRTQRCVPDTDKQQWQRRHHAHPLRASAAWRPALPQRRAARLWSRWRRPPPATASSCPAPRRGSLTWRLPPQGAARRRRRRRRSQRGRRARLPRCSLCCRAAGPAAWRPPCCPRARSPLPTRTLLPHLCSHMVGASGQLLVIIASMQMCL